MSLSLAQMAVEVLGTADGREKTRLSRAHAAAWRAARAAGDPLEVGRADPPLRPARPDRPSHRASGSRGAVGLRSFPACRMMPARGLPG